MLIADLTEKGKERIDQIHSKLESGVDFAELAKKYSDDRNSKNKGGLLPRFGSGRMVKPFEDAAFEIKTINQYSVPFKTRYGWHIVKLIREYPILSFNEMKSEIEDRIRRSGRVRLSEDAVLNRLKKKYFVRVDTSALKVFERKNRENLPEDSLQTTLLTINEKKITQNDFKSYLSVRRNSSSPALLKNFIDAQIITYYKENLESTNSDFASILSEYQEGLLLFEIMQQKIWNQSTDTIALEKYFKMHRNNYNGENLESIKGKVINDYQTFLDQKWIESLRSSNKVKIHKKMLHHLIKYYKREF